MSNFVYLKTPITANERKKDNIKVLRKGSNEAYYKRLETKAPETVRNKRLLHGHSTPERSYRHSENFLSHIESGVKNRTKWNDIIDTIMNLSVCLTTFFTADKGRLIGTVGKSFSSPQFRGKDVDTGGATACWDAVHQRTTGFVFFLGHFGMPTDLKHRAGYGRDLLKGSTPKTETSYSQRRMVCLDIDLDLYKDSLVMIHDAVWPRHLLSKLVGTGRKVEGQTLDGEVILEDVGKRKTHEAVKDINAIVPKKYDPHLALKSDKYFRAKKIIVTNKRTNYRMAIYPRNSVISGSHYRYCVALEAVRFAQLLGKSPASLKNLEDLISHVNYWVRPQVLIPGKVDLPGANGDELKIWENLSKYMGGKDMTSTKEFLKAHYKMVGKEWQKMGGMSSRITGTYYKPLRNKKGKAYRPHSTAGFRRFGWPLDKYGTIDARTWDTRSSYVIMWNGLPELAALSAACGTEITLDRKKSENSYIIPLPSELTPQHKKKKTGRLKIKWDKKVLPP